ncbi:tetratricopeptide repeat protein [Luteolibacter arcticus]|uniref:Tetratricopeptide repeat protein n=1 Tax=Luteolibacter arcticus TaxID=1581411 RepID=A0ABT3GQ65_9BACT|nr:tetratricopeptide repeat protein [Luteolibacter arcticus]MCW1925616.1 tetratricopeptide repeat protein [Luteolibacter arcticus]
MKPHFLLAAMVCASAALAHEHHDKQPTVAVSPEIERLTKLANLKGAGAQAWVKLGDALMQEARNSVAHDFAAAEAAYQKALGMQPESIDAMAGMAWVENSEHDFTAGKKWAEKVLAKDPQHVDAHALIGDGAVELGNYDEAFEHYEAALATRADLSTLSRASHLLWVTGKGTQAMAMMQRAIDSGGPYPENAAWCRAELALMNFHSGALPSAEQLSTKALEAAPENPRVLVIAARISAAKQDYPKAIGHYEKSASITPNHDALAALVTLYQLTGDQEKAKKQIERVIAFHEVHEHDGHAHSHGSGNAQLARFLADLDRQPELALKEAQASYETYKNVGTTDTLAWCLLKAGKPEEAKRMIQRAMKWNTPDAEIWFHAGMIEQALKNPDAAKRHFSKALSMNPQFHPQHAKTAADLVSQPPST